ncbi:MAG: molybdopterin-dependent oxidoreductase [Pseudomonadota bacterium]
MSQNPISLCHWGAFEAHLRDGRFVAATPWPGSGAPPAMIAALPDLVYSDTRILRPHIRESWLNKGARAGGAGRGAERMVPVDWDTALALVAAEIARVRDAYGHTALFAGSYGWSSAGRFHHARSQIRRFYGALGGFTDQTGNYSWGAAEVLLEEVLGSSDAVRGAATAWDSIIGQTDTFVAFGGLNSKNWHVTSGGAGHHHMPDHVRAAAKHGTQFIVISPFADDRPDGIDAQWIAPRPGSDTAIMLALSQEMVRRGRAERRFLQRFTNGAAPLLAYLDGSADGTEKTLAWAAEIADVPQQALVRLADRIQTGRVMVTATWSLQRAQNGEMSYWALIALAAILGQIGLPGGGFGFGYGSLNAVGHGATKGLVPDLPRLGNAAGKTIPVARFADMLETPGRAIAFRGTSVRLPHIRLIHWAGGNPFHHAQDLFRLHRLWQRPETIVVHEQFWTATAKRADIVLPATTTVERCDIGGTSRDRHVFYMPRLIRPRGQAKADYEIFAALADRLSISAAFTEGLDETGWLRRLWATSMAQARKRGLDAPDFDALRAQNVWSVPRPAKPEVLLDKFRDDPEGAPLATPSGRIELTSQRIESYGLEDVRAHPSWRQPGLWIGDAPSGSFALLSRQPRHFLHSQLAQTDLAGDPEIVVHAEDAAALGLIEGALVRVFSDRGACLARLRLTRACRRWVAAMETGPWFAGEDGLDPAGNPNALTSDLPTSSLSQATAAQSCIVRIEPAGIDDFPKRAR